MLILYVIGIVGFSSMLIISGLILYRQENKIPSNKFISDYSELKSECKWLRDYKLQHESQRQADELLKKMTTWLEKDIAKQNVGGNKMTDFEENLKEENTFKEDSCVIDNDKRFMCVQIGHYLYAPLPAWKIPDRKMKATASKKHGDKLIRLELENGEFVGYARKIDDNMPIGYDGQSYPTTLEAYGY